MNVCVYIYIYYVSLYFHKYIIFINHIESMCANLNPTHATERMVKVKNPMCNSVDDDGSTCLKSIAWNYPPSSNSHHQDYSMFSRQSEKTFICDWHPGWGVRPKVLKNKTLGLSTKWLTLIRSMDMSLSDSKFGRHGDLLGIPHSRHTPTATFKANPTSAFRCNVSKASRSLSSAKRMRYGHL